MREKKHLFNTIKDYYKTIIDLYQSCETDEMFVEVYLKQLYAIENIDCKDRAKMIIKSVEDLLLVFKAKYCIELTLDEKMHTAFSNAHYIAGDISREILLGNFNFKTLTSKQKEMFIISIYVDFSNIDIFDLRKISNINFIKDKNKKFLT